MSRLRLIGTVAWWEFRRAWRIKDVLITVAASVLLALLWIAVLKLMTWNAAEAPARIVVLESETPSFEWTPGPEIDQVSGDGRDEAAWRGAVDDGTIDGLARIDDAAGGWVYVTETAPWIDALRAALDEGGRTARLRGAGLSAEAFDRLNAGFELDVRESEPKPAVSSQSEKIAAGVFVGLMIFALFVGNSYLFMYITGEKQQRVTEQVVSIISPQTWIDGKIAGLSLVAVASMISMVVAMIIWNVTMTVLGNGYDLPFGAIRPHLVVQLFAIAALGFVLWFSFFGAIAATIDDPNTSSRSLFMFLPALALSVAGGCLKDPDSTLMRICAFLPPTAPSVLPMRLVLTDVAWWEVVVAIVLLIAAIWMMRRVAGKVFAMGIMMHGQELRWRDMVKLVWSA